MNILEQHIVDNIPKIIAKYPDDEAKQSEEIRNFSYMAMLMWEYTEYQRYHGGH